jgi:hypothetical protein
MLGELAIALWASSPSVHAYGWDIDCPLSDDAADKSTSRGLWNGRHTKVLLGLHATTIKLCLRTPDVDINTHFPELEIGTRTHCHACRRKTEEDNEGRNMENQGRVARRSHQNHVGVSKCCTFLSSLQLNTAVHKEHLDVDMHLRFSLSDCGRHGEAVTHGTMQRVILHAAAPCYSVAMLTYSLSLYGARTVWQ